MGELLVVPSIGGRDVACAKWPDIGSLKHLFQLLDVINDAFNVHRYQYSPRKEALRDTGAFARERSHGFL